MKSPRSIQNTLFVLVFLALAGFVSYSNSWSVPFQWDDESQIQYNPYIETFDVARIWNFNERRFLPYLSFAAHRATTGNDVFYFHLGNVFIHILCSLAVFLFVRQCFKTPALKEHALAQHSWVIAFASSLIFLAHPIQTQAVTYIIQRITSLCALFYIFGMYFYAKARTENKGNYFLFAAFAFVGALFSKQIAFTFPIILLGYEHFLFRTAKKSERRWSYAIPFFVILALYYFFIFHGQVMATGISSLTKANTELDRMTYFLSEINVIRRYIFLLLVPINLNFDHDFPVSTGLFDPLTAGSGLFLLLLVLLATNASPNNKLIPFSFFWFFLALSIESSFIPIRDLGAEHRLYLPMVGFATLLAVCIHSSLKHKERFIIYTFLIAGLLGTLTYFRNDIWRSDITLWQDVVRKSPGKPLGYANLGVAHGKKGNYQAAILYLKKALERNPDYAYAYVFLGRAYLNMGDFVLAEKNLKMALGIEPDNELALKNLKLLKQKRQTA